MTLFLRSLPLLVSTQLLMWSASAFDEATCGGVFFRHALGLGGPNYFDVLNFTNYPAILRNDSTITLAQAGTFTGPKDFEEYVAFATFLSPYVKAGPLINAYDLQFSDYNNSTQTCNYRSLLQAEYLLDDQLAVNPDDSTASGQEPFNVTYMINYEMYLPEPHLKKAFVYYPPEYLKFFFSRLTNEKVGSYICNELADSCNNTLDGEPHQTCVDNYLALPMTHSTTMATTTTTTVSVDKTVAALRGSASSSSSSSQKDDKELQLDQHFDGNSRGCRTVHAVLAESTPELHCPHIALTPMEDPNGLVKCQQSKGYNPLELFSAEDLETLEGFQLALGVDPELGYKVAASSSASEEEEDSSLMVQVEFEEGGEEEEDDMGEEEPEEEETSCDSYRVVCTVLSFFQSATNSSETTAGEGFDLEP